MKANGLAYFIEALAACIAAENKTFGELIDVPIGDEEQLAYTDGQLVEHFLPPRPSTNDLKAARRAAEREAMAQGMDREHARLSAEETLIEIDSKPRSATVLSRIRRHWTSQEIVDEFLVSNDFSPSHAADLALVAHDAEEAMRRLAPRTTLFYSLPSAKSTTRHRFARMQNGIRYIIESANFSVYVENEFKRAMLAFLESRHQEDCANLFGNTLTVLMRNEQELSTRAVSALDIDDDVEYLEARTEIMAYLLAVALCGRAGVEELSLDDVARNVPTSLFSNDGTRLAAERRDRPMLIEQLVDAQGGKSYGARIELDPACTYVIGRSPEAAGGEEAIRVRFAAEGAGSSVSRTHAVIKHDSQAGWVILDAGSTNGTAVAHLTNSGSDAAEEFCSSHFIGELESGEALQRGDIIYLAPARYTDGSLGHNPKGATYRFL